MRKPKVGDWVRFYRDAKLVIGVVQYVRRSNSSNYDWAVSTDVGETWDNEVLEIRSASSPLLSEEKESR